MPYLSKSEREADWWMSLNDAIEHIRKEGHDPAEARRQLFNALEERALHFRCADKRDERIYGSAPTNWQNAEFRSDNGGEVFCDKGVTDHRRELLGASLFRPITVSRRKVFEMWTASPPSVVPIRPLLAPEERDKGGRPSSTSRLHVSLTSSWSTKRR
jgi:hypothetical protein